MRIFLQSKSFRLLLIVCFIQLVFTDEQSFASNKKAAVNNIRHEQLNDCIIITYDLAGNPDERYDVSISLQKRGDGSFRYAPKELTGNIGENIVPGNNLTIEWNYSEEFPEGVNNADFYFAAQVSEESETSVSPWIWIGAALIVGGIVYFLVKKEKEEVPNEFPTPPGRP